MTNFRSPPAQTRGGAVETVPPILRNRKSNRFNRDVRNEQPQNFSTDPITLVMNRLDSVVKRHNGGWMAKCPAHDDKRRSLAVAVGRAGQVIANCFAGCTINEIAGAIGLDVAELFPRDRNDYTTQQRVWFSDRQVLEALETDSLVVMIAASRVKAGEALPDEDLKFLSDAVVRIHEARAYFSRSAQK